MTSMSITASERLAAPVDYPPAPQGRVFYVIGDIHGRHDLLLRAFEAIDHDKARWGYRAQPRQQDDVTCASVSIAGAPMSRSTGAETDGAHPAAVEIYLGDYIDRGENSRGVIEALIERDKQVEAVFLRGNHEQFLLDFMAGSLHLSLWRQVGAAATLQSYGVTVGQRSFLLSQATLRQTFGGALPESHTRFYTDTLPYFIAGPYLFVHAGLRPGIPLAQQHPADLMGIRWQFLDYEGDLGHIVVHGHTPVPQPEFRPNRINLDTGAYSTDRLTCLKIGRDGPELLDT